MTHRELLAHLDAKEKQLPEMPCRFVPTSFDPDDENMRAFPIPLAWRFGSLERTLRLCSPHTVMMRLPLFWQLESPIAAACHVAGSPLFVNEPENMPSGAAAIRLADVNAVITETADALAFSLFLLEKDAPFPEGWFIIHRAESTSWDIPPLVKNSDQIVGQEVHLFPGVPLLGQCEPLMRAKDSSFHTSEIFLWNMKVAKAKITNVRNDLVPLVEYELPFGLRSAGTCACGKLLVEKI